MKSVKIGFEIEDDEAWIYVTRSFGRQGHSALESPLHLILQWVVEQLSFGCWNPRFDENGEGVTLVLGKEAAHDSFDQPILDKAREYARKRHLAVNIAGILAKEREAGTDAKSAALIEEQRQTAVDNQPSGETISEQIDAVHPANAWVNTEYHYAFRFIELLKKIHEKMFIFSAPPIRGALPESISRQLGEATRAYLYGLNGAAVAMCRAILDVALQERIDPIEFSHCPRQVQMPNGTRMKGDLECMIDLAKQNDLLSSREHRQAHEIRSFGNDIMHEAREPTDHEAWQFLRKIASYLRNCASDSLLKAA